MQVKMPTGDTRKFKPNPKYLGIKLKRSLTFKSHLADIKSKVAARVVLVKCLTSLTWVASYQILQTRSLSLFFSPAAYCVPAWCQGARTNMIDTQFNEAMRTITGSIRSTPTEFLPCLTDIEPLQ